MMPRSPQISIRTAPTGRWRSWSAISFAVARPARTESDWSCGWGAGRLRGLRAADARAVTCSGRSKRPGWSAILVSSSAAICRPRVMRARINLRSRVPKHPPMWRSTRRWGFAARWRAFACRGRPSCGGGRAGGCRVWVRRGAPDPGADQGDGMGQRCGAGPSRTEQEHTLVILSRYFFLVVHWGTRGAAFWGPIGPSVFGLSGP